MKKVFLLAVVSLLVGCKNEPEIPDYVLSEEKMVQLLIDFRLAEGKVNGLNMPSDSARGLMRYLESRILDEHEVDSMDYLKSYEYYMLNSQQYLRINDIVIDSLKVRLQRVTSNSK